MIFLKKSTKSLEDKDTEIHTFRPKEEMSYNVVLKEIHSSTSIDEIVEEVSYLGHEVLNISNNKDWIVKNATSNDLYWIKTKPQQ